MLIRSKFLLIFSESTSFLRLGVDAVVITRDSFLSREKSSDVYFAPHETIHNLITTKKEIRNKVVLFMAFLICTISRPKRSLV